MLSLSLLPNINQDNNRKIVIFLLSLLFQAWIYIYVFANLHSILAPCLVSSDDTFLSSTLSSFMFLLSQVWIYLYVIAILHNILDPCLVSRGDIFLTSSLPSTLSLLSKVMISIHVIASLHNIVDSMLLSSGDNFTSSLLSLIMLKLFQANQRSLLVLILSSFLQLVCYNGGVIDWSIIGNTSDIDDTNSSMIFTSVTVTSDDNKTITVTNKIDYMTNKRDIFTQVNNHLDDILLWVLSSLLSQVWIYIYVTAILHSILDPCLVSSGDISPPSILSSIVYLLFQVRICMHVIAILHDIPYSLLPSCVDTCTLSLMVLQLFPINQCYHGPSLLNHLLGSSLFPEIFESWSFKSLFCNPYLGSRGCVRLQQGVSKIPKQCILILQSLYICQDPRVITTQDIMILQSVRLYLTNQRLWGCIICSLIHQVINYLLQMVYASSLCTLLQTVSVSSMYIYVLYCFLQSVYTSSLCTLLQTVSVSSMYIYVLYCFLQSVYTSSLFTSHLSVIYHGLWDVYYDSIYTW